MDKGRIFKIIQISFLCFFTTGKHIFAEESSQHEENFETGEDEEDDEDDEEEEEKEFEPLRKLPDAQPICPNLDRALDASMNKYKVKKIKVDDSFLKNLNFGIEMASLGKNLWFVTAQRKSKHRDYNFDYHGRVGTVWKHNFYLGGDFGFSTGKDCIWED
ncbi:MAG: hypothetical protein LBD32_01385, partial [Cytophagales bacterium]|nr:hypothetical protein [Cytophagales bacterium]